MARRKVALRAIEHGWALSARIIVVIRVGGCIAIASATGEGVDDVALAGSWLVVAVAADADNVSTMRAAPTGARATYTNVVGADVAWRRLHIRMQPHLATVVATDGWNWIRYGLWWVWEHSRDCRVVEPGV